MTAVAVRAQDVAGPASVAPDEVALLDVQLADARQENTRLKADVARLKGEIAQLAQSGVGIEESRTDVQELRRQLSQAAGENTRLQDELKRMDGDLEARRTANDKLAAEVDSVAATAGQRQKTVDNLLERLAAAEKQVVELQRKAGASGNGDARTADKAMIEELEAHRRNLEDENAILKGQVEDIRARLVKADADLAHAKADFEKMFNGGNDQQKQVHELKRAMEDIQATEIQRKETMDGLFKQLADLKAQNAEAGRQIEALKAELDKTDAARKGALSASDRVESEKAVLMGQVADMRNTVAALERERDGLVAQVEARGADIRAEIGKQQALQAQMDRIQMTDSQRKQAMDELLGKLADLERKVARLESERTQARNEALDVSRKLDVATDTLSEERASLTDRIADLEKRLAEVGGERTATAEQLAQRTTEAQALRGQVEELDVVNAKLRRTEEQRKKSVDELLGKLADAERQLEVVRNQMQTAETSTHADLQEKSNQIAALTRDNATLKEDVKRLERDWREAIKTRDELVAEAGRRDVEMQRQQAKQTELEAETTRLRTVDSQSKIAMDKLLVEVAETQARNRALEADIDAARKSLAETRQRGPERSADSAEWTALRDKAMLLETEKAALRQDVVKLEAEIKAMRELPRDEAEKVWADRMSALEAQVKTIGAERDRLRGEGDAALRKVEELDLLVARLRANVVAPGDGTNQAQAGLVAEVAELREALAGVSVERDRHRETAETQSATLAQLKADAARLEALAQTGTGESTALRQQLADAVAERDKALAASTTLQQQVDRMTLDMTHLQSKLDGYNQEMAKTRETWEREKAELAKQLGAASGERDTAQATLKALVAEADELRAENTRMRGEVAKLEERKAEIKRDSDLFKQVEQANVLLREKLVQTEIERERLDKELTKTTRSVDAFDGRMATAERNREELRKELDEARQREEEQRGLIEKFMVQIPDLERKIAAMEAAKMEHEKRLAEQETTIQAMRTEIERREHRLAKAERVAEVLQTARDDMTQLNAKEKRDMHYNMAAVYAREGKFPAAETEYLHALELDSSDADVHYNLAILYDDELKNTDKAAMHYRRYLKLRPHGDDADAVRQWLMKIEMKNREP